MSRLQDTVSYVLEGWTIPDEVRKMLESALYSDPTYQGRAAGLEEERGALIAQGRAEALAIILSLSAEEGMEEYMQSYEIGDTGDYGTSWDEKKLRELLHADDSVWNLKQKADEEFWHYAGLKDEAQYLYDQAKKVYAALSPTSSDAGKDDAREQLLYDLRKEGEQRFVKPLKFPDGYCTSPNGAIVPRAGAAEDYNFGYDVGFLEAWEILAKARTSTHNSPTTTDAEKSEAARYRWLRDMDMFGSPSVELSEAFQTRAGGALDSAIDQIMSSLEVIGKGEKG